jgi:hypothetical protein
MIVLARLLNSVIGERLGNNVQRSAGCSELRFGVDRLTSPGPRQKVDSLQD